MGICCAGKSPKWMLFSNKLRKCRLDGIGIVDSILGKGAGGGGNNLKISLVYLFNFFVSYLLLACSPIHSTSHLSIALAPAPAWCPMSEVHFSGFWDEHYLDFQIMKDSHDRIFPKEESPKAVQLLSFQLRRSAVGPTVRIVSWCSFSSTGGGVAQGAIALLNTCCWNKTSGASVVVCK